MTAYRKEDITERQLDERRALGLKMVRMLKGETVQALADAIGIPKQTLSKYENGIVRMPDKVAMAITLHYKLTAQQIDFLLWDNPH